MDERELNYTVCFDTKTSPSTAVQNLRHLRNLVNLRFRLLATREGLSIPTSHLLRVYSQFLQPSGQPLGALLRAFGTLLCIFGPFFRGLGTQFGFFSGFQ